MLKHILRKKKISLLKGIFWLANKSVVRPILHGIPKKDWIRNDLWFKCVVLPWIQGDKELDHVAKLLIKMGDYQEDGFAKYVKRCMDQKHEIK
jgi:hypothetical protein